MKENNPHILGEAPIGKLLVEYSIPAIIGMTLLPCITSSTVFSSVTVWEPWPSPVWPLPFR